MCKRLASLVLILSLVPIAVEAQNLSGAAADVKAGENPSPIQPQAIAGFRIPNALTTAGWESVLSQPTTLTEWQRQYDDAVRRRDGGSKKMKVSYLLLAGGVALVAAGALGGGDNYSGNGGAD